MFNIDIASLRDPATLASVRVQIREAAMIVKAYEAGDLDADDSSPFQSGLRALIEDYECAGGVRIGLPFDLRQKVTEAYNLGWDTVRLQRGVNKNAK